MLEPSPISKMRARTLLLAVVVAPLFLACQARPIEVYRRMLGSAQIGYEEGFVQGFSARSRAPVRALLRLTDVYGFESRNPLRLLDADDALNEEIFGERAVVMVTRGSYERPVLFVADDEDGGEWRVDLAEYERFLRLGPERYFEELEVAP